MVVGRCRDLVILYKMGRARRGLGWDYLNVTFIDGYGILDTSLYFQCLNWFRDSLQEVVSYCEVLARLLTGSILEHRMSHSLLEEIHLNYKLANYFAVK